ncbi:MAG: glycosyl hydrolase family 28-related protein [Kiritimatiellales bacterium]|jgi:hypothetical protein
MKTVKRLPECIRRVEVHPLILAGLLAAFAPPCLAATLNVPPAKTNAAIDTANIQNTLNDAARAFNTSDDGVAVIFPKGTYVINQRLVFKTTNCPPSGGGIMIRGQGQLGTIIQSGSIQGALLLTNNVDECPPFTGISIQIEDIAFLAAVPNAGPAVEVAPYMKNGKPLEKRTTPRLRNVRIARAASLSNYYSYGFKGNGHSGLLMDDVTINGRPGATDAGISFSNSYGHTIKDCTIDGAKTGISHYIGGEANFFNRVTITNVQTGIKVQNVRGELFMSASGGTVLHSSISASECGVSLEVKDHVFISDNTFNMLPGGTAYKDVQLKDCSNCFVTGNRFQGAGSVSRTGVCLLPGSPGAWELRGENVISDNSFLSTPGTGVSVAAGVNRTVIFNNRFNMTNQLIDSGDNTRFAAGTPNLFVSPAAAKDTETFNWGDTMGKVFDVTGYVGDDTAKIKRAAADAVAELNLGSARKAALYFPAGTYKVTDQISLAPANGANLTICGDGPGVSVIERSSGGSSAGVFKLNFSGCPLPVRTDIHNLKITVDYRNAGDGIYIKQPGNPVAGTPRNLYMHNVDMKAASGFYFSNSVHGVNLARPFFENVGIRMYKSAEERLPGTAGILLENVWGFEGDNVNASTGLWRGYDITSRGGEMIFKKSSGCPPAVGARINAGGGRVAIEGSHFNAPACLEVANASAVSWMNCATLCSRNSAQVPEQAALRLENCRNVDIRHAVFDSSADLFANMQRRGIWLKGTANTAVNIYGNLFSEPGSTDIYTDAGSAAPAVSNNVFTRTDVDDIAGPGEIAMTRLYHLNGKPGQDYLLKNKASGKYLRVTSGTALACNSTDVNNASQWKVVYDRASDRYTLESKAASPARLMRDGTNLRCEGSDTNAVRRWLIVNRGDGYYTLGGAAGSFVRNDSGTVKETGVNPIDDNELWQFILAGDLVIGMDRETMDITQASGADWTHADFIKPFPQVPAVFAGGPSCNDTNPLTVRVKNVSVSGFDFQLDEWDYLNPGAHGKEQVSFIAVNKGCYTVSGRTCEAGTITGVNTNWTTKAFSTNFPAVPCVFAQCTSTNEKSAVCTRVRNVTTTGFQVMLQEQQMSGGGAHANETVDFIAIDPGMGGRYFEVNRTTPGADSAWKLLTVANTNETWNEPGFLGSVQSCNLGQPCALRYQNLTGTNVQVKVDEDGSNGEVSHGNEDVGWMIFNNLP